MPILTKAQLSNRVENRLGYRIFNSVLNEARIANKGYATTTVFLSHSHLDKAEVEKAIVFLRELGISVYVDWADSSMPPTTNMETARKIKERIISNRKFILLATKNAIASKWCNWELGFGDAKKYIEHIALFPLSDNDGTWSGQEYLKIYPRIEYTGLYDYNYQVIYPDGTKKNLTTWLTS